MKKNPLEEIYSSKVLLNEEAGKTSNVVAKVGDMKIAKNDIEPLASGGATEKIKSLKKPAEAKGTEVLTGELEEESMETPKAFEGAFEKLFKATLTEEEHDIEDVADEAEDDVEIPTTGEEMADELEDTGDEVSDLVSDLEAVMNQLQSILDKISSETKGGDEVEMEFGEEAPANEAVELKAVSDSAGKSLMKHANKVGNVKPKGGKATGGDIEADPELKPAKAADKAMLNPKSKPELKSTVKRGEFFK